jgi:hypothetical protein
MKMTAKIMALVIVGAFVIGIGGSKLIGYWKTTSTRTPIAIKAGEFAGLPNPADIRGSYTWADVARAFNFDVQLAMTAFGATDAAVRVSTLETIYPKDILPAGTEIGTGSVRLFVSLLVGLPLAVEEDTIFPIMAIDILRQHGKADSATLDALEAKAYRPKATTKAATEATTIAAPLAPTQPESVREATVKETAVKETAVKETAVKETAVKETAPAPSPAVTTPVATETHTPVVTVGTITGKTTFKDLKSWGLDEEKIKSVTGGKIGPDLMAIKDWATANEVAFSDLKNSIQKLLDAK